jgi:hypothetical protein
MNPRDDDKILLKENDKYVPGARFIKITIHK